jgi:hypothetical protein
MSNRGALALGLLALTCGSAAAQAWEPIGTSDNGVLYLDRSTIKPERQQRIKAWAKYVLKKPEQMPNNGLQMYQTQLWLTVFDCAAETSAGKQFAFYAGGGDQAEMVGGWTYTDAQLVWEDAIPGSLGQILMRAVCSRRR